MIVRRETLEDRAAVNAVTSAAFGRSIGVDEEPVETRLLHALQDDAAWISAKTEFRTQARSTRRSPERIRHRFPRQLLVGAALSGRVSRVARGVRHRSRQERPQWTSRMTPRIDLMIGRARSSRPDSVRCRMGLESLILVRSATSRSPSARRIRVVGAQPALADSRVTRPTSDCVEVSKSRKWGRQSLRRESCLPP